MVCCYTEEATQTKRSAPCGRVHPSNPLIYLLPFALANYRKHSHDVAPIAREAAGTQRVFYYSFSKCVALS